jgi:hypothetical protein
MVRLALDLGMRGNEVYDVQLDDIHADNAYVFTQVSVPLSVNEYPVSGMKLQS